MSLLRMFGSAFGKKKVSRLDVLTPSEGFAPDSQDTIAAINELSQAVKANPNAVEIYLALGNLYRQQGEIERAVQIRYSLIVRPTLDGRFKARAWYELGRDYKRAGFLDRAADAFERAQGIRGNQKEIVYELARLAAETKDYEKAVKYYSQLKQPVAQAHYLTCQARDAFRAKDESEGRRFLGKALKVNPGSVEAWMTKLSRALEHEDWRKLERMLREAVEKVKPEHRFLLLEGLLDSSSRPFAEAANVSDLTREGEVPSAKLLKLAETVLPVVEDQPPDLLLSYYAAWMLITCRDFDRAKVWLEKALVLRTDFWPARLELLAWGMVDQPFSPVFKVQLEFFIDQVRQVKRFVCRNCGLKRDQVFYICPRCQSWHSIVFRTILHD